MIPSGTVVRVELSQNLRCQPPAVLLKFNQAPCNPVGPNLQSSSIDVAQDGSIPIHQRRLQHHLVSAMGGKRTLRGTMPYAIVYLEEGGE